MTADLVRQIGRDALLVGSAVLAGAINAIAGGGTLISFPAAIAWGLPSTIANATNAVAMTPGSLASAWGYRRELRATRATAALLAGPAVLGGIAGAALLRHTSQRLFDGTVPWLVLGATLLILLQGAIVRRAAGDAAAGAPTRARLAVVLACQLLVGVYGGYFGAAMGIVTLAFLSLIPPADIQHKNAIKNLLGALINGVASIYFIASGLVNGRAALLMMAGATAGGFAGARLARRASPGLVRALVVAIGLGLSALLAYRRYASLWSR
jgi:uncharacterized membrane protein YfcA